MMPRSLAPRLLGVCMTGSRDVAERLSEIRVPLSRGVVPALPGPEPVLRRRSIRLEPASMPTPALVTSAARRFLATVLFIDMVDSTRRAFELGDSRWLDLQEAHEAMLRQSVGRFGGRSLQTLGDGLVAIFDSAAAAVGCAASIVDASRRLGVEIRAGLHAGECEQRGKRLGGIVFHIAARVLASAGPSEVLISRTVKELVTGSGFVFARRGRYQLKGLPGGWWLFALDRVPEGDGK